MNCALYLCPEGQGFTASLIKNGHIQLNSDINEYELFTKVMIKNSCGTCKSPQSCLGGCPAEELVMGSASCSVEEEIIPICRLWKSDF